MMSRPVLGLGLVAGTTAIISAGYIVKSICDRETHKANCLADTEAKLTVIQAKKEAKLTILQAETGAYFAKAKARRWW